MLIKDARKFLLKRQKLKVTMIKFLVAKLSTELTFHRHSATVQLLKSTISLIRSITIISLYLC